MQGRYECSRVIKSLLIIFLVLLCGGGLLIFPAQISSADDNIPVDIGEVLSVALIHCGTKQLLISHEPDLPLDVAGLTRLAPMLMISEAIDEGVFSLDDIITVSSQAASIPGPTAFIEANERISLEALYKSAVMVGAADATYALVETVFKSPDAFLPSLNSRIAEIGVTASYTSVLGNDDKFSAYDLAKIGERIMETDCFFEYSTKYMDEIAHENAQSTQLVNPNRLIRDLSGCTGLATGSSSDAGYSGVFSATRGNDDYICVVIGAKNSDERFRVAKAVIEYAFATYSSIEPISAGDVICEEVRVSGSTKRTAELIALEDVVILTSDKSYSASDINMVEEDIPDVIEAPKSAGEAICSIRFTDTEGNVVSTVKAGTAYDLEKFVFRDYIAAIIKSWLGSV